MMTKSAVQLLIKLYSLTILLSEIVNGFNIATKDVYVAQYGNGGQRSSYFGYSVAILKTKTKSAQWLLVGAPRANTSSSVDSLIEPGSLFKCNLKDQKQQCGEILLDTTMNSYKDVETHTTPIRNHAWTGAAMDIDKEGNVVIGAHRWSNYPNADKSEYFPNGLCYFLGKTISNPTVLKLPILLDSERQLYIYDGKHNVFFYQYGQSGMSVHLTNTDDLLVGAPGVLNWRGTVTQLIKRAGKKKKFDPDSAVIPNPIYSRLSDNSYFGYSLTSGKFDYDKEYYIVAGAPRGASAYGAVFVFLMIQNRFSVKEEKTGIQLGEYFGASVAALDLNGDKLSDLVVGAPLHLHSRIGDAGCVYVYINSAEKRKLDANAIKLLGNPSKGARFGTALGTPGDLDNDGFEDLLVGAPYENNHEGAVYVFMGFQNGIRESFAQKITPKLFVSRIPLKGFGISFSRAVDVDNNKYPDFAVGSFLSDAAVLMKTRPVITVHGKISSIPSKLSVTHNSFIARLCLSYSGYGAPSSVEISITVVLSQDSEDGHIRGTFAMNGNPDIQLPIKVLEGKNNTCQDLSVNLAATKTYQPIHISMTYDLTSVGEIGPVLNPHSLPPIPITLTFGTGCRNELECHTDLVTTARFPDFPSETFLLIGTTKKIVLEVEITNKNEPALLPNITISYPSSLKIFPSGLICDRLPRDTWRAVVGCQLKSPLLNSTLEKLIFEFDVSSLDDSSPNVEIRIDANSAAEQEDNPTDNSFTAHLNVKKNATLMFRGTSYPEQYTYELVDEDRIAASENEIVKMQSRIAISKSGVTPLGQVNITVYFPSKINFAEKELELLQNFEHELSFQGRTYRCEENYQQLDTSTDGILNQTSDSDTGLQSDNTRHFTDSNVGELSCSSNQFHCIALICQVGPWDQSNDMATLTVSYDLNLLILSNLINVTKGAIIKNEVYVYISSLQAAEGEFYGPRKINGTIITKLIAGIPPPVPLAWWIYFLAILGGLILLSVIAFVLFKVGFFKRKKRMQMEAQKALLPSQEGAKERRKTSSDEEYM